MSALSYRLLKKEDLPGCADVILAAFRPVSEKFGFQEDSTPAPLITRLEELLEQEAYLYGCFLEGQQVGFFLLSKQDEEIFEISKLCVLPDRQGQGLGNAILETALETIRTMGGVSAVGAVIYENTIVRTWLTHRGFFEEFVGMLSGTACSICLMQKDLPQSDCGGCSGCGDT